MSDIERRYEFNVVEARARGDKRTIGGYAAKFGRPSQNLGGFIEQIDPRAFNKSRGDGWPDVMARYNHDDGYVLGTTAGGTLRLSVDKIGLDYEVDVPMARADVYELIERGDVSKSSFAFRTIEDDWGASDQDFPMRTLLQVGLVDVAPVNLPAYTDTTSGLRNREVALRSLADKMDAPIEDILELAAENELRKLFRRTDGGRPAHTFGPKALMEMQALAAPIIEDPVVS